MRRRRANEPRAALSPRVGLATLLEGFFRERLVVQQHASVATISAYRDALRLFITFAAAEKQSPPHLLRVDDLDQDRTLAFLHHVEIHRGNSVRTRNARLAAIRAFYRYVSFADPSCLAVAQRILSIPSKRLPRRRTVNYLSHAELGWLLSAVDRSETYGLRDYALALFLARVGARVSESVGVACSDVRFAKPFQVLLHGKGRRDRCVPLGRETVDALRDLLELNKISTDDPGPLFRNARGGRLSRHGVAHILRRTFQRARSEHPELATRSLSPHTLRHTCAMHLLHAGVDLTTIRSWLGHASVTTTNHYAEASMEMKRRALEHVGPVFDSGTAPPTSVTDDVMAVLASV